MAFVHLILLNFGNCASW